nr:MAG TPA: hypothetical protein [Caudoviricetes sp.]
MHLAHPAQHGKVLDIESLYFGRQGVVVFTSATGRFRFGFFGLQIFVGGDGGGLCVHFDNLGVCKLGHAEVVMLLQFGFEARHIGRGEQILIHIDAGGQLQEHLAPGGIVAAIGPLPEPRAQSFGKLVVHISAVILSDTKLFRPA